MNGKKTTDEYDWTGRGGMKKRKGGGAEGQLFIKAKRQGQARSEKELYAGVRLRGLSMKILVVLWASTIRERTDDGIRDERREWFGGVEP